MKALNAVAFVALLAVGVSCSRDPQVVKRKYVENGNRYFEKGKYKEAHIMYRNALRHDRKYGEAYYRLGLTELKLGQTQAAYGNFLRATQTDANNIDAKVQAGNLALAAYLYNPSRGKQWSDQLGQFAADILKRQQNNIDGLRLRGYYRLIAENKPAEALSDFQRANGIKPLQPDIVLPLVETLYSPAINQPAEAEKLARALIAKEKNYFPIYDLLYIRLVRANRVAEAEDLLKSKVAGNPKNYLPLLQLAAHYQATNRPDDMKRMIESLVSNPRDFPAGRMEAGRFYARLRDYDTARRYFEEGAKNDQNNRARYQKAIADVLILQRRPREAQLILDDVIKQDAKDEEAKAIRAALRVETGDPGQIQLAINEFESSIKQAPRNPVTRFNYARALIARRQLDQARTQLQEAVRLNPLYLAPRLAIAELQYARGEYGGVRRTTTEILEKVDPDNLPAKLLDASALSASGERDAARKRLEGIISQYPNSADAKIQLAVLDLAERKYDVAEASFSKLYKANPADLRGLMGIIDTYAARGQYDRAVQMLKEELNKAPDRRQIRVALGNLSFKAGKFDDAIVYFRQVLELNPKSGDLYLKLGDCYRAKSDFANAIANYQTARDLQPNDPLTNLQLAVLYDTTGRRGEAKPAYEQVLRLQPDNAFALNNLAYLIAETGGDLDQALAMAQRAKERMPEHPDVADTLGWIYIKKQLSDNAIQIFTQLVSQQPDRSTFRYHLGLALFQKGDKAGAKRELTAALEKKPTKEEETQIRNLLARIG